MSARVLRGQFSHALQREAGKWNTLFPRGEWHGANLASIGGRIDLTDALLSEMVANWSAAGRPPLPIRKTHRHLDDNAPAVDRLELERAYGFLTDLRVTAAGLEALTEWNAAGRAEVESGSFAFWSPEWQPRHHDRKTGEVRGWWLSGAALTNDPFFNEMPPVAATTAPAAETTEPTPTKEHAMDPELKKRLFAALKIPDTTTDEELCAAMEARCAAAVEAAATLTAATATHEETLTAALAPLKAELETLRAEKVATTAAILSRDVAAAVSVAKQGDGKTGRAVPATLAAHALRVAASDGLAAAVEFLAALPLTVPVTAIGIEPPPADTGTAREKFDALVDAKVAAGMRATEAYRVVTASNPELADIVFPRSNSTRA